MMRRWLGWTSNKLSRACVWCARRFEAAANLFVDLAEWFETPATWSEIRSDRKVDAP